MRVSMCFVLLVAVAVSLPPARCEPVPKQGNFHIHSHNSYTPGDPVFDHAGAPDPPGILDQAAAAGLNVIGFSEHAEALDPSEWASLHDIARTGGPVAIRGFEWTPNKGDHVNVFGSADYYGCSQDDSDPDHVWATLQNHLRIAAKDPSHDNIIVAQFNHIGWGSVYGAFFNGTPSGYHPYVNDMGGIFALCEMGWKQGIYRSDEAKWRDFLNAGWHVAPTIGLDNFGDIKREDVRRHTTVLVDPYDLANSTERIAVMRALKARRVYASESEGFALRYKAKRSDLSDLTDWFWMGSTIEAWKALFAGPPLKEEKLPALPNIQGYASPGDGIPAYYFAFVATTSIKFESGTYRFNSLSDDGIRVLVDGKLVIDNWTHHAGTNDTGQVVLTSGLHKIEVYYCQENGAAALAVSWAKESP